MFWAHAILETKEEAVALVEHKRTNEFPETAVAKVLDLDQWPEASCGSLWSLPGSDCMTA